MHLRIVNLDHAVTPQTRLINKHSPEIVDLSEWGPKVRICCGFSAYRRFQDKLAASMANDSTAMTFIGSGDFHHVSLALLQQIAQPFNLLIIDKHPDWMRWIPLMHCGTWVRHALGLPNVQRVFHIGGDLDFDNLYRLLAPWPELRSGRMKVLPAFRQYRRGWWAKLPHCPLMRPGGHNSIVDVLDETLHADLLDLRRFPLYISLDKDAMSDHHAVVNWDSGTLGIQEVQDVLQWFQEASGGNLAGMDVVGDWSPVRLRPGMRTWCHWMEHPRLNIDPLYATPINQAVNEALIEQVLGWTAQGVKPMRRAA